MLRARCLIRVARTGRSPGAILHAKNNSFIENGACTSIRLLQRPLSNSKEANTKENGSDEKTTKKDEKPESFQDTLNRLKGNEKGDGGTTSTGTAASASSAFSSAKAAFLPLFSAVKDTWKDLIESGKPKDINKKIRDTSSESDDKDEEYSGPVAIMVIDESENLTAWERMQRRLTEAPIIQGILERAEEIYEKSGARKVREKVEDIKDDAKEAWETSQNPWVYRISSVYDTLTAESEYAVAVKKLRELDPHFSLEEWKTDVVEHTLPQIMSWFLKGDIKALKPWLGEAVHNRIAAEIAARKKEGVQIDTHVLGIMNSEILACEPDTVNKGDPIILLHYMCQQINCVKKKSDGEIVEGAEDDIRANSYVVAFQREYDEDNGELNWKIVDFRFNGAIAYL